MFDLSNEKPARLEGALIENLFVRDLLDPAFKNISTGWWFTAKKDAGRLVAIKLSATPEALSKIDFIVASKLVAGNLLEKVIFVCPESDGFGWVSYDKLNEADVSGSWRAAVRPLRKKGAYRVDDLTENDRSRTRAALGKLTEDGFLEDVRMERFFAGNYLNIRSWDMDAYVVIRGQVVGFEVKQKYPMPNGTFGINVGLNRLFQLHTKSGIPVWHIILTKPVQDKDFSAIELITNPRFADKSLWIGTLLNPEAVSRSDVKYSPDYTSLSRKNPLGYYEVPCTNFFLIKQFSDTQNKLCMQSLLKSECRKLLTEEEIPVVELKMFFKTRNSPDIQ